MKRTTLLIASGGLFALVAIAASVAGGVALGRVLPPAVVGPEASSSHAPTPPALVSFQGLLTNPMTGEPVADGAYSIVFSIFDVSAGGAALWTETQPAVAVEGGVFSVLLGSVTPLPDDVFAGAERYLGVTVGGDPELTPRQRFVSVAYAMHALTADSADSAETLLQDGVVGLRMEPTNAISPNLIGGFNGNSVTAGALGATIGGGGDIGFTNRVTDNFGTVGGGRQNQAGDNAGTSADRLHATVGGGLGNTANGNRATVGGGANNGASGLSATVGGGQTNMASASRATVGGGLGNTASADWSTVGGGNTNTASGPHAAVGGGASNTASGDSATVGGGQFNTASGSYAAVPGGAANSAAGDYSFAAGRRAVVDALHDGAFLFADQFNFDFDSAAANEFAVRASGGFRFRTSFDLSTGCNLPAGSGTFACTSDRSVKANFAAVVGGDVLEALASVPIETWNYTAQDDSIRHIGPTAQDFYAAFGLGEGETTISTVDTDGVALAAIQGLYELAQEKDGEIAALRSEVEAMRGSAGAPAAAPAASTGDSTSPQPWLYAGFGALIALALVGGAWLGRRRRAGGRP